MTAANMEAKELAIRSRVSQRYVFALLAGENEMPRIDKALALARALNVSLDWLATGKMWQQDALTPDEDMLVMLYRSLPDNLRQLALDTLKGFSRVSNKE
jgi:transcriptional regulator with XRE-family HTH domain